MTPEGLVTAMMVFLVVGFCLAVLWLFFYFVAGSP